MPDITITGANGTSFSTITIESQSTANNSDRSVHFDTILDNSKQTTANVKNTGKVSMSTLNEIFDRAASTYGIDADLLKAVARQESNFTANATSSSGAMGIMQLMPGTAKSLGVKNAYDPEENIMGGAKLLASHLRKYNGNVTLALAAYNAGSGAVDKYHGVPPYGETQNYVKRILQYYDSGTDAPDIPAMIDGNHVTRLAMSKEDYERALRDAELDERLKDIPTSDIYVTSNEDTQTVTDSTYVIGASDTDKESTKDSSAKGSSDYSYDDFLDFAKSYMDIASGSSSMSLATGSSQNTLNSSYLLNNALNTSNIGLNSGILNLLQAALAKQKDS